jgi:hypothetical protein
MIVYITGSLADPKDTSALRRIIDATYENGGVVANDWIEPALETVMSDQWIPNIDGDRDSIQRADIVIVEASHYDFSQGFRVGIALECKKPVLVVSRLPIAGKILSWIDEELLVRKEYQSDDMLVSVVNEFIANNKIPTKDLRFNLFIDRSIHSYLEDVSRETGKNKSDIIRSAIERGIKEDAS